MSSVSNIPAERPPLDPSQPLLSGLRFVSAHRCFAAKRKLVFVAGVNLLVGDQGCGKSTLLQLLCDLTDRHRAERTQQLVDLTAQPCKVIYYDFEKANPRVQKELMPGLEFSQIHSLFRSHGETVAAMLETLRPQLASQGLRALIALDEPDMALSPRSAYRLAEILQELAEDGHQVMAAVHNPIVIASQPRVLSLEHDKWMSPTTFLRKHKEQ